MSRESSIATEAVTPADAAVSCLLCAGTGHERLFTKFGYDLLRCRGCALIFVGNPPPDDAVEAFYSADQDYHTELFDPEGHGFRRMQRIAERHLRILRKSVPHGAGLRLLDIGCSTGLFLNAARADGYALRGVELSAQSAAFARAHFDLDVHAGDLESAGLEPESFNVITLFDVIEHMPDPLAGLQAIRALLKPGGLLLQSTPNIDGLFPRLSYPVANLVDYWPHPEPPHHLFQFSVKTLKALTARAGFSPCRTDQTRIGLDYSFGTPKSWKVSPKLVPYAMLFAPAAIVGPWIGMGDWFYLAARKPAG